MPEPKQMHPLDDLKRNVQPSLDSASKLKPTQIFIAGERACVTLSDGSKVSIAKSAQSHEEYQCIVKRSTPPTDAASTSSFSDGDNFWDVFSPALFAAIAALSHEGAESSGAQIARLTCEDLALLGHDNATAPDIMFSDEDEEMGRDGSTPDVSTVDKKRIVCIDVSAALNDTADQIVNGIRGVVAHKCDFDIAADGDDNTEDAAVDDSNDVQFVGANNLGDAIDAKFQQAEAAGAMICIDGCGADASGESHKSNEDAVAVAEGLQSCEKIENGARAYAVVDLLWKTCKQRATLSSCVAIGTLRVCIDSIEGSNAADGLTKNTPRFSCIPIEAVHLVQRAVEMSKRCADSVICSTILNCLTTDRLLWT